MSQKNKVYCQKSLFIVENSQIPDKMPDLKAFIRYEEIHIRLSSLIYDCFHLCVCSLTLVQLNYGKKTRIQFRLNICISAKTDLKN